MPRGHEPGTPRVGRLDTPAEVRKEAARLYRRGITGKMAPADCSRMATVLLLILRSLEAHELERHITELEALTNEVQGQD